MEASKKERLYERIAPTAWGVVYLRSLSDIKYAKDIFDELSSVIPPGDEEEKRYLREVKESRLAPLLEARYKLIDRLLEGVGVHQILELAAGLAPRGLAMSEQDPSLNYVELDLPDMVGYKREMLQRLSAKHKIKISDNLHLEAGDVLNVETLFSAARHFHSEPVAVVNEGLLRYLNFDQKVTVARNVHMLLEKFGGAWITSDITLKEIIGIEAQERIESRKRVFAMSGIDVEANSFESEAAAREFFEGFGFSVEPHRFVEIEDDLVSPKKLGLSTDRVREMIGPAVAFVMRARK